MAQTGEQGKRYNYYFWSVSTNVIQSSLCQISPQTYFKSALEKLWLVYVSLPLVVTDKSKLLGEIPVLRLVFHDQLSCFENYH